MKKFKYLAVILITILVIFPLSTYYFIVNYYATPNDLSVEKVVLIEKGNSLHHISKKLAADGVIKHPKFFTLIARYYGVATQIQAGQYLFLPKITPAEVIDIITSGRVLVHKITIAEGLMSFQVLEAVAAAPYLTGNVPDSVAEGSLLPETYNYVYGEERAALVKRMQDAMENALNNVWENNQNPVLKNKLDVLTLASIIEKETSLKEELRIISGVFTNRLQKKMRLQTDPTVIYAITKGAYQLDRPLFLKDLTFPDPYNTYTNYGLPPGPIANPGLKALEAATDPIDTDYIYFVASGDGGHNFAETYNEHKKNIAKWRKKRNQVK